MREMAPKRMRRGERGITGLETSIILIAFVVVASVFIYTVISARLWDNPRDTEPIVIELKGNVMAKADNGVVTELYLTLGSRGSGLPVDFVDTSLGKNTVVVSYADSSCYVPSMNWTMRKLNSKDNNTLLQKNELIIVTVNLNAIAAIAPEGQKPGRDGTFTLEVKPPVGPALTIERTVPPNASGIVNLK